MSCFVNPIFLYVQLHDTAVIWWWK